MSTAPTTGIAIVGTGYVADAYRLTLPNHAPHLDLVGAYDRDAGRLASFVATFGGLAYPTLEALLADPAVAIVVNLTDPHAHLDVSRAIIAAGKHLYTEKPLAMTTAEAEDLRNAALDRGVRIAAAPCNLLGEAAQTLWKAVRGAAVGEIRLVYAELDDGMIHKAAFGDWLSRSGKPWPARGEFEVGCTFEHAGYVVAPLAAMFGPVVRVTAFAALVSPDKVPGMPAADLAPDFSVGCLEFESGVVARITNSIVAPYDHRLRLIGERGVLEIAEPWDYAAPVRLRTAARGRVARFAERRFGGLPGRVVPAVRAVPFKRGRGLPTMDFMRGVRELADAIVEDRPSRLDADFAVHVTEVTEMLQYPERFARPAVVRSRFTAIAPMDWAL